MQSLDEARHWAATTPHTSWCLKYPTGCGASGHRLLTSDTTLPDGWPLPLVVQEFIRMERPEVYRLYAAGGQLFGWVARCFPVGVQGARPGLLMPAVRGTNSRAILRQGRLSRRVPMQQVYSSHFGADSLRRPTGEWVVLEVGTDGMFNYVDRELGLPELEHEIQCRIAEAFWQRLGKLAPVGRDVAPPTASWGINQRLQRIG